MVGGSHRKSVGPPEPPAEKHPGVRVVATVPWASQKFAEHLGTSTD